MLVPKGASYRSPARLAFLESITRGGRIELMNKKNFHINLIIGRISPLILINRIEMAMFGLSAGKSLEQNVSVCVGFSDSLPIHAR
jgi:hypothetical protein